MQVKGCKQTPAVCLLLGLLLSFAPSISVAKGYCPVKNTWFLSLGAGGASIGLPSDTTVNNGSGAPAPADNDTYSISNASATMTQLAVGYRWHQHTNLLPNTSLSLQYRHYMNANITGAIDQFSTPGFTNYNYQMKYGADMFILNAKIDLIERRKIMPFLVGGLGVSLTHMNDYTETPTAGVTARTSPGYQGDTIKRLVATVGAGLDYAYSENIWVTVGYEHVFQSSLKSRPGLGSWSGTVLHFGNPDMDTLYVSLTANFPDTFRG